MVQNVGAVQHACAEEGSRPGGVHVGSSISLSDTAAYSPCLDRRPERDGLPGSRLLQHKHRLQDDDLGRLVRIHADVDPFELPSLSTLCEEAQHQSGRLVRQRFAHDGCGCIWSGFVFHAALDPLL